LPELRGQVFKDLLDGVMRTGIPYEGKEAPAQFDRRGDGKLDTVYFNFVYAPLRGIGGGVEGVLVIAFDVTDEIIAREEMARLRQEPTRRRTSSWPCWDTNCAIRSPLWSPRCDCCDCEGSGRRNSTSSNGKRNT
jgi:hypothetical protein